MRRLVAGASARCCILVAFLALTVDAGPARASERHDLDETFSINLATAPPTKVPWGTLVDTQVSRWGFGVEQAFDAAGLLLYAQAHVYDPRINGSPCLFDGPVDSTKCGGNSSVTTTLPATSWQGFVIGARIQF